MYKKIVVFICCIVLVSKTVSSQIISVEGVSHADTVQYSAPFSLNFWFVNTGNTSLFMDSITANISISPVSVAPPNWQILTLTQNIPQGIFAPGDSISILNTVLNGGPQLYQQAGDNIVVIWPSFVTPVTIDTSFTPLYVLPNPSSIQEYTTKKELLQTIDILGRETKGTKNEPLFYIYDDGTVEKRIIIE